MSDTVVTSCPHCAFGIAANGSSQVLCEGLGITRINDAVVYGAGAGMNATGNPTIVVGG